MPNEEIVRTILHNFVIAGAWADARAEDGESVDYGIPAEDVQLDPETEERVLDMIRAFLTELDERADADEDAVRAYQLVTRYPEQAGHDLWLTMRRHGAGFWDRGYGTAGDLLTELAQRLGSEDAHVLVHTTTAEQANAVLGSPSRRIPEITLQYPS